MGGEKRTLQRSSVSGSGSPPRGRGKVPLCDRSSSGKGITPAWAGKRPVTTDPLTTEGDHPRVGGEKLQASTSSCQIFGSPPRGRGKVRAGVLALFQIRITPAWAGKRCSLSRRSAARGDHPRVGGEKGVI